MSDTGPDASGLRQSEQPEHPTNVCQDDAGKRRRAGLLSIADACAELSIGTSTGYDLQRRGSFPVRLVTIGSRQRVLRADLERYLERKRAMRVEGRLRELQERWYRDADAVRAEEEPPFIAYETLRDCAEALDPILAELDDAGGA